MSADATRGIALQSGLRSKCLERPARFGSLQRAKKRLERAEHSLNVGVSLGDPLEVVDLAVAFDSAETAKHALQSQEDVGYDTRRAVLRR